MEWKRADEIWPQIREQGPSKILVVHLHSQVQGAPRTTTMAIFSDMRFGHPFIGGASKNNLILRVFEQNRG